MKPDQLRTLLAEATVGPTLSGIIEAWKIASAWLVDYSDPTVAPVNVVGAKHRVNASGENLILTLLAPIVQNGSFVGRNSTPITRPAENASSAAADPSSTESSSVAASNGSELGPSLLTNFGGSTPQPGVSVSTAALRSDLDLPPATPEVSITWYLVSVAENTASRTWSSAAARATPSKLVADLAPQLIDLWEAAKEMRNDPCASVNYGCNSVQSFDAALAGHDRCAHLLPADSLDAAWAAAEAALPEGWAGPVVGPEFGGTDKGGMPLGTFHADAFGPNYTFTTVEGNPTPAAALNALAAQLTQAGRKEPK